MATIPPSGVPPPVGLRLAGMASGPRGVVLFMIARGDYRDEIAEAVHLTPGQIDALLREGDGCHHDRPRPSVRVAGVPCFRSPRRRHGSDTLGGMFPLREVPSW